MELYLQIAGQGPPLVLLHGLFGSHENLGVVARGLSERYTVYAMDLRNHGRSPHAHSMDYTALARDVSETMDAHSVHRARFLGHSLGGKTAMELALSDPDRVERLVVADIAPIAYERHHDRELQALQALTPSALASRREADEALAPQIPDPAVRQFLLKNLVRGQTGFEWRIPFDTIAEQYDSIAAAPPSPGPYHGPVLFVRGGNSDYVPDDAWAAIHARFPRARIETIPGGAHWVHAERPEAFLEFVGEFLDTDSGMWPHPGA